MTINRSQEGRMIKPGLGSSMGTEADDEGLGDMDNTMGGENADESTPQVGKPPTTSMDPSDISSAKEMTGPAKKVIHGRPEPKGHTPKVTGSMTGTGSDGGNHGRNTMGHGERVSKGRNTMGHRE